MSPSSIKGLITLRGETQTEIARAIGASAVELSQMISGEREYAVFREKFAAHLGMRTEQIFDEEFDAIARYRKAG